MAQAFEPGTGNHAYDRFEAGRKLNEMGVPVRYKFKPMIPIRGWREDYAAAIEYMLRVSQPESVGFCVIMWMSLHTLGQFLDLSLLEEEYITAAQAAAAEMEGNVCAPFPTPCVRKFINSSSSKSANMISICLYTSAQRVARCGRSWPAN